MSSWDQRAIVSLAGVTVRYDDAPALTVSSLAVDEGEILAVIGPNGSGKSTLLRVIGLLQRPAAGAVRYRGTAIPAARLLETRRRMATVFQEPLLADATVFENAALGLHFRGVPRPERIERVGHWLERLGIGRLAERRARTLSGGEAQRCALARALVLNPEVLLLDEPFSALDQPTRDGLIADLGAILRRDRITTVLVTHDRTEARALADRVAVMMRGEILQIDTPEGLFRAPVSEAVARFVGVETLVEGSVVLSDGVTVVEVAGQKIQATGQAVAGERVRVCLRPEDVTLVVGDTAPTSSSARNHLSGAVVQIAPVGADVRVVVDCGFKLVALVTQRSVDELGLAPGTPVTATFKATAPHLIRLAPSAT